MTDNGFIPALAPHLERANLNLEHWRELLLRLLDYGVLCRAESQVEQELYDHFVRLEEPLHDYLALAGMRLQHDARNEFVRVLPPGASVPGVEDDSAPYAGMRTKLSQSEVALALILRIEYDKALREGQVENDAAVLVPFESIILSLKNLLGRELPESAAERRRLLRGLKQLRLIDFNAEEQQTEPWLRIRPLIVTYVSDNTVDELWAIQEDFAPADNNPHKGPDKAATAFAEQEPE